MTHADITMKRMFIIMSHHLSERQRDDARESLGVDSFISMPDTLKGLFRTVNPESGSLESFALPFKEWLSDNAAAGDHVLIQGDSGLTYILVNHSFTIGCVPVYSTTERMNKEIPAEDGSVELIKMVKHVRFRRYEK